MFETDWKGPILTSLSLESSPFDLFFPYLCLLSVGTKRVPVMLLR